LKYVLDTDTLIYCLNGKPEVVQAINKVKNENLYTTIFNYTELLYGAYNSVKKKQNLIRIEKFLECLNVLFFNQHAAHIYAEQKAMLRKQRKLIDDLDLLIASISLQNEYTLVTNNEKHFQRIKKLSVENWSK
jgi:tRNA(fMet)-specific endonuclease VapC